MGQLSCGSSRSTSHDEGPIAATALVGVDATIYGDSYHIHQSPGYVTITYEMVHDTRVIPIAAGPHVAPSIRQYVGDARGHWEGTTLVVVVGHRR